MDPDRSAPHVGLFISPRGSDAGSVRYDHERTEARGLQYLMFCYYVQLGDQDEDGPLMSPSFLKFGQQFRD